MSTAYDRLAAGDRLRLKRTLLGWSQDEMAEKISRATKYYADIERGNCGMSIETLISLSTVLHMPVGYILFGDTEDPSTHTEETKAIFDLLDTCSARNRNYALRMLKLFLAACDNTCPEPENS